MQLMIFCCCSAVRGQGSEAVEVLAGFGLRSFDEYQLIGLLLFNVLDSSW